MNERLLDYFRKFILYQQDLYDRISLRQELHSYTSLSPIDNADEDGEYAKALLWALKNKKEKDIKNIAITGPYGSGKSSVLKTFQRIFGGTEFKFLNISLATFKDEISSDSADVGSDNGKGSLNDQSEGANKNGTSSKEEMLRLIELSILQQIFYHEKDSQIPDSRFKKIKRHSTPSIILEAVCLFIFFTAIINLGHPEFANKILNGYEINKQHSNIIHWLSVITSCLGILLLIAKSVRMLSKVKLKLSFTDTEIEIDENISKSILNHHIDELIYFFEATPYNIVVIEDLDRFNQTEIFTKLREINLLLNNSKKIKKDIVFIYAVRDDMFKDKERAKFFDFIIPIIPVINTSNSSQKLLEYKKLNHYRWKDDLIEDIALFISDMRLLHNIVNEFHLYLNKLNKELDQNKLLAILIYKNIFPGDFAQLSNGDGTLYNALHNKRNYILAAIKKIDDKIAVLKNDINDIESIQIRNVHELRSLYLLQYAEQTKGVYSFIINGVETAAKDLVTDENFDYFIANKVQYKYYHYGSFDINPVKVKFSDIENKVDRNKNYKTRLVEVNDWHEKKVDKLKKQIQDFEQEKISIRNWKIKEVLAKDPSLVGLIDGNQKALVNVLLRNGYIDEDYFDYISIFYEGTLTKRDYQFLLNVKSQKASEFDFQLNRIEELIKKVNLLDFEKEYILNFQLVEYLLNSKSHEIQRNKILDKLSDESAISTKFIDDIILLKADEKKFVNLICKKWVNIWNHIQTKSLYPENKKSKYFRLIIENADIVDIQKIASQSDLVSYILSDRNFLNIISDESKLIDIINALNIEFIEIDEKSLTSRLLDFIYESNSYDINYNMLKLLIRKKGVFNQASFDTQNYTAILNSNCDELITYIKANLNTYVENIYLRIETNTKEEERVLLDLLNSDAIAIENKKNIISQVETKISKVEKISTLEMMTLLFKENTVIPTWENLFYYFKESNQELSETLIEFIDQEEIVSVLSKSKIPTKEEDETLKNIYSDFIRTLIKCERISDENYELMLASVPYFYSNLKLNNLNNNKITRLIRTKTIRLSNDNFSNLKEKGSRQHIMLIEEDPDTFLKEMESYSLDGSDLLELLKSTILSDEFKAEVLGKIDEKIVLASGDILKAIGEISAKNNSFVINEQILKRTLRANGLSVENKIKIFNERFENLDNSFITEFLNSLGEPYSNIVLPGKKPSLTDNEWNVKFAAILEQKKYISSYDRHLGKGIRINTFKKEQQ